MNLIQFYKEHIKEDEYYYSFYNDLITNYEAVKKDFESCFGPLNDEMEYEIFDDEEAIDYFKKLIQPECDYNKNNNKYHLVSYYLYKNGYTIEEYPRILQRPEKNLVDFAYSTIRGRLIEMGLQRPNGDVPYAQRKLLISKLHFKKNTTLPINLNEEINKMFQKISTRSNEFFKMKKDEQLQEIANLIENMLLKDGKFLEPDYTKISFDYIDNETIKKYRKQIQCFRHAKEQALEEREAFTDNQKDFLIHFGIVIITTIYNLLYTNNH